ncbi:MAG: YezD family protein [Candidatus Omnitrophica bacterium]|nr:YezD family protein [Candidatus Omnitrophota bacterium]
MLPSNIKRIKEILKDLKKIKYGSIEILVHDGAIVQIEKKEKIRLDKQSR